MLILNRRTRSWILKDLDLRMVGCGLVIEIFTPIMAKKLSTLFSSLINT